MISTTAVKNLPNLVFTIAAKNIKIKYKNSLLGFVWSLLHPLAYLLIFIFVFSHAFPDIDRYPLFALVGLMFWTYFNNTMNQMLHAVIGNASILKSLAVPRLLFPLSSMVSELITLGISIIPFFGLMFFFGLRISWETLLFIPVLVLFALFAFGIGLFLCTLNVFFRDVGILWNTLSPAVFYFTPIAYSSKVIPEKYLFALKFNPLYHFIEAFRDALYYNRTPALTTWLILAALAVAAVLLGIFTFNRLKKSFISFY